MKIIDILNKIANKEFDNLPKTIKYKEHIFKLGITRYNYFDETGIYTLNEYIEGQNLTDEIEILETTITLKDSFNYLQKLADDEIPNKIEKLEKAEDFKFANLIDKINEIIDKVNEL